MSGNCISFVPATARRTINKKRYIQATVSRQKNGGDCYRFGYTKSYKTLMRLHWPSINYELPYCARLNSTGVRYNIGLITSHCLGNEPSLRRHERAAEIEPRYNTPVLVTGEKPGDDSHM